MVRTPSWIKDHVKCLGPFFPVLQALCLKQGGAEMDDRLCECDLDWSRGRGGLSVLFW